MNATTVSEITTRAGRWAANLFLVVGILGFLGLAIGPRVLGYRTETMLTGSMAPIIVPGDVVVSAPIPAAKLAVGQVITYQIPVDDHRVISHRVIEVHTQNGVVTFRTKGDANESADPWTAQIAGAQAWTVRGVVPWAGTVIRALRDPYVSRLSRIVIPTILALSTLRAIWIPGTPKPLGGRAPARPLSRPLGRGMRNPYAVSVYPRGRH